MTKRLALSGERTKFLPRLWDQAFIDSFKQVPAFTQGTMSVIHASETWGNPWIYLDLNNYLCRMSLQGRIGEKLTVKIRYFNKVLSQGNLIITSSWVSEFENWLKYGSQFMSSGSLVPRSKVVFHLFLKIFLLIQINQIFRSLCSGFQLYFNK